LAFGLHRILPAARAAYAEAYASAKPDPWRPAWHPDGRELRCRESERSRRSSAEGRSRSISAGDYRGWKRGQCGLSPTKGRKMKSQPKAAGKAASKLISERIAELGDWRGDTLARMRALITEADPDVVEEWKWRGTPVWSHDGGICTGESYKSIVKLTFFKGASLKDPAKLFNSSLEGNARRAIDIHEGEEIDANAFKALIRAAVALNTSGGKKSTKREAAQS
jgi:hypothetical protein